MKAKRTPLRMILRSVLALLVTVLVIGGGYVGYVIFDYSRIGDVDLEVTNNQMLKLAVTDIGTKEFSISTYNIGFGAYDRDYSFFMDKATFKEEYQESQKKVNTTGKRGRAVSKDNVLKNTNGAYETIVNLPEVDFALYQEVDTKSTRSFKVNQHAIGQEYHDDYASVFGINYHSSYLAYPLHEPIGKSTSGISTFSKYHISDASRGEFKITDGFFAKFFDLDRAFTVSQLPVGETGQSLFIFNVHMSAYDATGEVRKAQLIQLKEAVKAARDIDGFDNYVIVGGDFNHDLLIDDPLNGPYYKTEFNKQELDGLQTDWYNYFRLDAAKDGMQVENIKTGEMETYSYDLKGTDLTAYGATNLPSARDASIPFIDANNNDIIDNFMCTIDGFLVSQNIEVTTVRTIGSWAGEQPETLLPSDPRYGYGFVYSDHNPVLMTFKLA